METLYWSHQYAEHGVPNEIEDDDFDANLSAMEAEGDTPEDDFEEVINDERNPDPHIR